MNGEFNISRLQSRVEALSRGRVLIVGDALLDEYLLGDASRISPEAPVPVVLVEEKRFFAGGAGNVARNIKALGGDARLIACVGDDQDSVKLRSVLAEEKVDCALLTVPGRPTTVKTRVVARQQQMLRIDREDASPLQGEAQSGLMAEVERALPDFDVVVVSDYGKGVVTQSFMDGLKILCANSRHFPRILVDPKSPNFPSYAGAFLLTPNAKESSEAAGLPAGTDAEIVKAGQTILEKLQIRHLLSTLGPRGMALFLSRDEIWHIPTTARKVYDVTGAGDTVIATTALALAAGLDLMDACVLANYAAGIVVGEPGAATASGRQLLLAISSLEPPHIKRWI